MREKLLQIRLQRMYILDPCFFVFEFLILHRFGELDVVILWTSLLGNNDLDIASRCVTLYNKVRKVYWSGVHIL